MGKMSKWVRMELMSPERRYYGAEAKFRDRRGREHYDNGRFAPMRNDTNVEIGGRFRHDFDFERFPGEHPVVGWYDESWDFDRPMHAEHELYPMYMGRDGMRGEDYDMAPIGFRTAPEWPERSRVNEWEHRTGERHSGYARGSADEVVPMTRERAEKWVQSMQSGSGAAGQHWSIEQARQIMTRMGYHDDPVEFYVAMNMMKNDYTKAAQKLGVDKEEFYAAMADAFLNDEDAHKDKLARYYAYIAR